MALTISEKWICERVHLDPENLDDVRSLALPGTYHEKITHLGSSLQNLYRLKHLDLSRNALQSLDGLQHLSVLEKLNIYYNNISTLKDLYQLRHNMSLLEVDLRLNPVTKNEPDYRLFMVHMLPNLRKLDDRSVRESERKAALMHFNSDQATELTEHPPAKKPVDTDRVINPRVEMITTLPRKTTVLDDDDCDVLDLIARSGGDLGKPRDITGSKAKVSQIATHSHQDPPSRESSERPSNMNELPSTKYPPSPPHSGTLESVIDRPKRRNTWDERENVARNCNLEGDMMGLEITDNLNTPKYPAYYPSTSKSPSLPLALTPNISPDIGMRPVIDLYHNMSALKTTVIQSYLDDHYAKTTPRPNTAKLGHRSSSANVSPAKSPKVGETLMGKRHRSGDSMDISKHDNHSRDIPVRDTTGSKMPLDDSLALKDKTAKRHLLLTTPNSQDIKSNVNDMWEYGVPLSTSPGNRSKTHSKNSSWNTNDEKRFQINKIQSISPTSTSNKSPSLKTPQASLNTNQYLTHDVPPCKTNKKSVSFSMSPASPESSNNNKPIPTKLPSPLPSPLPALRVSLKQTRDSNSNQSKRVCAVITNSPPKPKGDPTLPAGSHPQSKERVRVQFVDETGQSSQGDMRGQSNMKYADESQAYTAYTSKGHFTPHPDSNPDDHPWELAPARNGHPDRLIAQPLEGSTQSTQRTPGRDRIDVSLFLNNFLTLVDRYWNGTKSLHRHGKFQSQAHTLLTTLINEIVASVPQEHQDIPKESSNEINKLHQALRSTQDQVENLKGELDAALADKRQLQERLDAVQREKASDDERHQADRGIRSGDQSGDRQQAERGFRSVALEREVERLSQENGSLKLHVKHFNQLQELATMLQESHKSLVTTNDHLLQELDETKHRHLEEVKQLHWSYSELKHTIELAPNKQSTGRHMEQHHNNGPL